MGSRVFISYSSKSLIERKLLEHYLQANDITSMWIDENEIRPGENIDERLKDGVSGCSCCVFLLNQYSLESTWCIAEIGAFWGLNKRIIVFPIEPRCSVPPLLAGLHVANDPEEVVEACKRDPSPSLLDSDSIKALSLSGLVHAFRIPKEDGRREMRVKELVINEWKSSEHKKFRLVASSGYNYLHPNGQVWKAGLGEAIEDGAEFHVVLESPFSQFAITRALANKVKHTHWDEKGNIDVFESLHGRDNVTINVTEHPVNCSLFFTSEAVFYDPYLWALPKLTGRTENNFWVFEFGKAESETYNCYGLLEKHFDFLADESIPLKEFLGEDRKRYDALRQEFRQKIELRRGEK